MIVEGAEQPVQVLGEFILLGGQFRPLVTGRLADRSPARVGLGRRAQAGDDHLVHQVRHGRVIPQPGHLFQERHDGGKGLLDTMGGRAAGILVQRDDGEADVARRADHGAAPRRGRAGRGSVMAARAWS